MESNVQVCTGGGGGGTGVASTITVADESSDATCFPVFATAATGDVEPKTGSNLTFNSSNGTLTATTFSGALTGNASGSSGSCTGNSATATVATNAQGLTGTPDITVRNIIGVGATLSGVLTYEDVTFISKNTR